MKNVQLCTIYLVRHGRTDWNDQKLIQGHIDIPLNSEGKTAAKELANELKKIKFDKVYSSDLLRAKETAEIISLEHQLTIETTVALRERTFGNLEGKSHSAFPEMDRILNNLEDKARYSYKFTSNMSMESDEEVMNRFIIFLREIAVGNPGKTILVATHAGPMWMFLVKLGLSSYQKYIHVGNLGYIKLESDGVDFFIKETSGIEETNSQG
jgi:broad specificity phosphatase PhoE